MNHAGTSNCIFVSRAEQSRAERADRHLILNKQPENERCCFFGWGTELQEQYAGGWRQGCWTDLQALAAVVPSLQVRLHLDSALPKPLPLHPTFQSPCQESYKIVPKHQTGLS